MLGSAVLSRLDKSKCQIIPLNCDITDQKALSKLSEWLSDIDVIIHAAAITDVKLCEENQKLAYSVNVLGTRNMRMLAEKLSSKLVYISTASVFLGENGDYKESDFPYPKSYYDLTKYLGEQIVSEYEKSIIIRTNIIGVHNKKSYNPNFFEWVLQSAQSNRDMTLYNDVFINPLSCQTLADLVLKIIASKKNIRVIHLGSRDRLSKAAIAKLIISKVKGYNGTVKLASVDAGGTQRPKNMWLNVNYADKILGMNMPSISNEIDRIFEELNK